MNKATFPRRVHLAAAATPLQRGWIKNKEVHVIAKIGIAKKKTNSPVELKRYLRMIHLDF